MQTAPNQWTFRRRMTHGGYQLKINKVSGITNEPNDWAEKVGEPRYILDLLLSIITVSINIVKIVHEFSKLEMLK